jgi:hypothetical protein
MPGTVVFMAKDYAFDFTLPTIVPHETEHRADFTGVDVIRCLVAFQPDVTITVDWRVEYAWCFMTAG